MYHNIGILRNLWLGDSIVYTPFLRKLRKAYPDAKITVYAGTGKVSAEFFNRLPYVDEIVCIDAGANIFQKLWFGVRNFRKHDLFIDTFESTKIGSVFANILGKRTVWFSHSGYHTLNIDTSRIDRDISIIKKEFLVFEKLWLAMDLDGEDYSLDFPSRETDMESCVLKLWDTSVFAGRYVCIHPSSDARYSARKFEAEKWNAIIQYLLGTWWQVVIIGTLYDTPVIDTITQVHGVIKLHTLNLNIWETWAIIQKAALFLGINSWPGWVATALRINSIILNGPSLIQWEHPENMFPFVKSIRWWYQEGDCYKNPCDALVCRYNLWWVGLCMKNIETTRVIGAIVEFQGGWKFGV